MDEIIDKLAKWLCAVCENGEPYHNFADITWEQYSIGCNLEDIREGHRALAHQLLIDIPELEIKID